MQSPHNNDLSIPLTVPSHKQDEYLAHITEVTHHTGNLFLFAGDQKIEHLNDDFYGPSIAPEAADPEHLFRIAAQSRIGVFATQMGLISRYGSKYNEVPYVIKLNSKTNLVSTKQQDPLSSFITTPQEAITFKNNSQLPIVGMGYTIYLGSEHEATMLQQASQMIQEAHNEGLVTVLWIYPRGKAVFNEKDSDLIAGAAGVGACLGADFVKVNPPVPAKKDRASSAILLKKATSAAGNTGVICSGGSAKDPIFFLEELYEQIHTAGTRGCATGRNIHQKALPAAIGMCQAIAAIVLDGKTVDEAAQLLHS